MKGMRGCGRRRPDGSLGVLFGENGLARQMRKSGLNVVQQGRIVVFYDNVILGEYTADLIVKDRSPTN